jgi:hypothetical protein
MAFDRQAAKDAGYTDDEINAFVAANPEVEDKNAQQQQLANEPPAPSTVIPEINRTNERLGTAGLAVAPIVEKAAELAPYAVGAGAAYYAKNKLGQVAERGLTALEEANKINAGKEARLMNRPGFGGAPTTTATPSTAPNYGNVRYNVPTATGPAVPTGPAMTGPVAPSPAAVNAAEQGLGARVRDAAAQRIANLPAMGEMLGGAARMAGRVLGPASLALQTTDLGPQTPQLGRMRGMEINPLTGQRWTPEQIRQYESNPNVFDAQLAQPQMRR